MSISLQFKYFFIGNNQVYYKKLISFQFNREKTKTTKAATLHNSTEAINVKQAAGGEGSSEDDTGETTNMD